MYPTFDQIKTLHKKYAPSDELFDLVFTHCQIVWELSEQIIHNKKLTVNIPLVQAGALLHDIGSYTFMQQYKENGTSKYYQHALAGYQILRDEGLPEDICLLVRHHMRIGLTKEQVQYEKLDLPAQDYLPTTMEEKIVMYADKFHSKNPQFNSFNGYKTFVRKFGDEQVVKFEALAKEFGVPNLEQLVAKYGHPIK